ncbi:MAG TPA: hypothetical protein PLO65_15960 [Caulobacter sp.]|nr:hypothetical protein [Caulobacter sp.]
MIDGKTRDAIAAARGRSEFVLSARMIDAAVEMRAGRPDTAAALREQAWLDVKAAIVEAVGRHGDLRVLRSEKVPPGVILAGPANAWLAFLDAERDLANDRRIELREYVHTWRFKPLP